MATSLCLSETQVKILIIKDELFQLSDKIGENLVSKQKDEVEKNQKRILVEEFLFTFSQDSSKTLDTIK